MYKNPAPDFNSLKKMVEEITATINVLELQARETAARGNYDALTKLYNRNGLQSWFEAGLKNTEQKRSVFLHALMVDLDHFKKINDTYGHAAGDETLENIAALLLMHAPKDSAVARMGGEEFIIVWMSDEENVYTFGENIRKAISAAPFTHRVSASLGGHTISLNRSAAHLDAHALFTMLYTKADAALYASKHNGRNQMRLAA